MRGPVSSDRRHLKDATGVEEFEDLSVRHRDVFACHTGTLQPGPSEAPVTLWQKGHKLTLVRRLILLTALVALLFSACSTTEPAPSTLTTSLPEASEALEAFEITIDDTVYRVAVADTPARRSQGLMGVTDLGPREGMLFVFDEDVTTGFWMKDTLIPLDIAYFDADGLFVDAFTMVPCTEDPCTVYTPAGPYRYAVEAGEGQLAAVGRGSVLVPDPEGLVPPEN